MIQTGRLKTLRKLKGPERRLVDIHDKAVLWMEILYHVEKLHSVDVENPSPKALSKIVSHSFNLGSLTRLWNDRYLGPDVVRGRKLWRQTSRGGSKGATTRTERKEAWRSGYQEIAERICSEPGRGPFSYSRLGELVVKKVNEIGEQVRKGETTDAPRRLMELLRRSDFRAGHRPSSVARFLAGRR
jgi:hypothetical protein